MNYPGYDEPNYTQTPNALFDDHLRDMGDAELRVVLCAIRKTFGYHKQEDGISLTQFQRMTGLSRQGVIDGIDAATQRGLLFLDDGSSAQSRSGTISKALAVPHAFADIQLDSELNADAITRKLDELERIARRNGSAIGVASAFDESVDAISAWSENAATRGIELVSVSALANDPKHP